MYRYDATIFLERAPKVEVRGGLVFISYERDDVVINRCMRVSDFKKFVRACNRALAEWHESRGKVVPIKDTARH